LVSWGVEETNNSFAMDLLRFLPAGRKRGRVQKKVRMPACVTLAGWLLVLGNSI